MPGSHVPILAPSVLEGDAPDYLLILPWNLVAEVMEQNKVLHSAGTRFVTAVPELVIQ